MVRNCVQTTKKCATSQDDQKNETDDDHIKSELALEEEPEVDYDPYHYGNVVHPTIFWGPVLHLLKTVVGTGILAVPFMFKSVGYMIGIVGTISIGYIYAHTLHMLLEVEYKLCKKMKIPNLTYVGVVQHSFEQGPKMFRKCTSVVTFLVYFHFIVNKARSNAVYLITIGGNFKIIIDNYYNTDLNIITIMSVAIVPLVLLGSIRNLKFLVPLSMLTNVFNVVNLILILAIPTSYNGSADFKPVNNVMEFPTFFAVVLSAIHGTGMILPLKNDMKNPKKFSAFFGVLNIALSVAAVLYCVFGFFAYSKYGEQLKPNVLFNLPPGQLVSLLVLALYSMALSISYTLFVYIGFDTVWVNLFKDKKIRFPLATEYGIRIGISILPYFIAVALPDFRIMLTLGGVIGILMEQALPPILHVFLLMEIKKKTARTYLLIFKDIAWIIISLILFIAGFINVIRSIIKFYSNKT